MSIEDLCQRLGVGPDASPEAMRKAYRTLAKLYHPDKMNGDENRFKEIAEAYKILSDEVKSALHSLGEAGLGILGNFPEAFIIEAARLQENIKSAGGTFGYNLLNLGRVLHAVSKGNTTITLNGTGYLQKDEYAPIVRCDLENVHIERLWMNQYCNQYFASVEIPSGLSSRLLFPISDDLHDVIGLGVDQMRIDIGDFQPVEYFLRDYHTGKIYTRLTFMSHCGYTMAQALRYIDMVAALPQAAILTLVEDKEYFGKILGLSFNPDDGRNDLLRMLFGEQFAPKEWDGKNSVGIQLNPELIINTMIKSLGIGWWMHRTAFKVEDYLPKTSFPNDSIEIENGSNRFIKNASSHGIPAALLEEYIPGIFTDEARGPLLDTWDKVRIDNVSHLNTKVPAGMKSWQIHAKNYLDLALSAFYLAKCIVDQPGLLLPVSGILE